jgi:hypothetical protein
MGTVKEMAEFVMLLGKLQELHLVDRPGEIKWRWSAQEVYSAKSAYYVRISGYFCSFIPSAIWSARTEGKHRLFAWIKVQSKILTADCLNA